MSVVCSSLFPEVVESIGGAAANRILGCKLKDPVLAGSLAAVFSMKLGTSPKVLLAGDVVDVWS